MTQQLSKLPKTKLNVLASATRMPKKELGQIVVCEEPSAEDWAALRAKYPTKKAYEERRVLKGMLLKPALFGLIAWLSAKEVHFYKNLTGHEVLKFSWNGKLAIIYAVSETKLGRANPAGHDAVDEYLKALDEEARRKEAGKQKIIQKPIDNIRVFNSKEDLLKAMLAHEKQLGKEAGNIYSLIREYLVLKLAIAEINFDYHIIDLYVDWLNCRKEKDPFSNTKDSYTKTPKHNPKKAA